MDLDVRLKRRYEQLVRSHMITSELLSSGVKSSIKSNNAFSQTQAAWRFFNNERCKISELIKPILAHGVDQSKECDSYALMVHDWSGLIYKKHESKKDRYGVHNKKVLGYELQASLLLSDVHGGPIAPVALNVATADKVLSTYNKAASRAETHLEELAKRIHYLEGNHFKNPLVHIIDREGDSVQLMRALAGRKWLVRCRRNSTVTYQDASVRVDKLASQLPYTHPRTIKYKGMEAEQYLASTEIQITRAARPKKTEDGKRKKIKGEAVKCRFIVSRVQDKEGKIVAWWYLLTNVETDMATVALWYYWRWSIEIYQSYYLRKSQIKINEPLLLENDKSIAWVDPLKLAA
jgi:hypothetical protein